MKFKVGEIVEVRSCCGKYEGWAEREIISGPFKDGDELFNPITNRLENVRFGPGCDTPRYLFSNGYASAESHMRKKRPKQQDNQAGTWSECPFIPEDIRAKS